jgi:hypothetical protein
MKNVLIISGHPDLSTSVANATILDEVAKALPDAEIRRLDSLYPDYRFDIAAEQAALLQADVVVLQFPFSWYSMPGLLKLWLDKIFQHGFSHGSKGKLGGKKLLFSFTTGAPAVAYQKDGSMKHTVEDYFPAFASTAALCNLDFVPPIYTCGLSYTARDDDDAINAQKEQAREHAARLIAKIKEIAV